MDNRRTKPLNVSFVITSLPIGGAETLLVNLVRQLDKSRFRPHVLCLKAAGELGDDIANEVPLTSSLLKGKFDVRILPRLIRAFRTQQTDAVITVGAGDKMFWGRLAAKIAGVPVICSALHSTGWPDGVGRLNRLLTRITDAFIACAHNHASYLVNAERFPPGKVFMIPNGVDTARFRPDAERRVWLRSQLNLADDVKLVGIVAALREEKNHQQLVLAARDVLRELPNTQFVVVGEGPMRAAIENSICENGLTGHFHLLGKRSDTHLILPALDAFVLTSQNEANPVSILEALSCGIPVAAPRVGSIHETVIHEKSGLLTTPLDPFSTADALLRLLGNTHWARQLGSQGRTQVKQSWSLDAMVEGYENLLIALYNSQAIGRGLPEWRELAEKSTVGVNAVENAPEFIMPTFPGADLTSLQTSPNQVS